MAAKRQMLISALFVSLLAWAQSAPVHAPQGTSTLLAQVQDGVAQSGQIAPPGSTPQPETQPAPLPDLEAPPQSDVEPTAPPEAEAPPSEVETAPPSAAPYGEAERTPEYGEGAAPEAGAQGIEGAPKPEAESAPQGEQESAPQAGGYAPAREQAEPMAAPEASGPAIWRQPQDIASLDLYYGQGGRKHVPMPPFTFVSEDRHGSSPKFDARDANNRKWRVKLGPEARPEVVASRLLWAVGYFVNDDYVIPSAQVRGLRMKRHSPKQRGSVVIDARFAHRPGGEKKIGEWKWKDNPFFGTREFNGLRVMMAVLNNWDLKDNNNAVYEKPNSHQQIYLVSDVGASFGTTGLSWTPAGSKGQPSKYRSSKFILRDTGTEVDFATPSAPSAVLAESFGFGAFSFLERKKLDWIGKNIPNPDAHWIGTLLAQLSHKQLVDAFRAGNFSERETDAYVSTLESRIEELKRL